MTNSSPSHPDDQQGDEAKRQGDRPLPQREPGTSPEREPGNTCETPDAERPPHRREEGTVSDPDFPTPAPGTGPAV